MAAGPEYKIRAAAPGDLEAVLEVLAEGGPAPDDGRGDAAAAASDQQRRTWERVTGTPDLTVYLAEQHGVAIGTAAMLLMPHVTYDCRPTAFIEAVVVRRAHRRRGVARRLLEHALDDALGAGCLKVQLLSHKRHAVDGAHQLYRSLGFTPEAEGFRLYLTPWNVRG